LSKQKDTIMDVLYSFHDSMIKQVSNKFYRFLYDKINWDQRLIAIKGPRGAGKTTIMLQRIRFDLKDNPQLSLYLSADHYYFYNNTLAQTVEDFVKNGGRYLFIDEVHKYHNWSREIKNIYDAYPGLSVVISASSALELYKGEADLSRRMISYELPGLSFREFLKLRGELSISEMNISEIVLNHIIISRQIIETVHPLPLFKKYLKYGYLPFYKSGEEEEYLIKLNQMINTIIDVDLAYTAGYNAGTANRIKRLLGILSESVPFKPNIAELARKLSASRDSVYEWLTLLGKAQLLNLLVAEGKSTATLQKPEKIFFENSNLAYSFRASPDIGNLRETFLLNQLSNAREQVSAPPKGDFKTNDFLIEVGGKNKPTANVQDDYIIAADNIETGYQNKIPLWVFGFLY